MSLILYCRRCCEEIRNGTFTEPEEDQESLNIDEATRISLSQPNRCPSGFRYNSRLNVCDDVDECQEETHDCDPTLEMCVNTIGDYICDDLAGDQQEEECPSGFRFFLISCIDIDECSEQIHDCSSSQVKLRIF